MAGVAVVAMTAVGCLSEDSADELFGETEDSILATPVPSSTTTVAATTPAADDRLVSRCIDYVEFQAYVGREDAVEIWDRAGQTAEGLRAECEALAVDDPAAATRMADEMDQLDEFFAGVNAAETDGSTAPPATTPAGAPQHLVDACVAWVQRGVVTEDPGAIAAWEGVGRSESELTRVCENIALADPATAQTMFEEMQEDAASLGATRTPATTGG